MVQTQWISRGDLDATLQDKGRWRIVVNFPICPGLHLYIRSGTCVPEWPDNVTIGCEGMKVQNQLHFPVLFKQ